MTDDDWTLCATKKDGSDRIFNFQDTNIYKIERGDAHELFKVEGSTHQIWSRMITAREASEYPGSKEIYHGQSKDYSSIDLDEGYIILEDEREDFQAQPVTDKDKAKLLAREL